MKKNSILVLSLLMMYGCNKTELGSEVNKAEMETLVSPPSNDNYIDLTTVDEFTQMIGVDSTLSALMAASSVTSSNYYAFCDALDHATTESKIDSILSSYGIDAEMFIQQSQLKISLLSGLLSKYPEFEGNNILFGNSVAYSYEFYFSLNNPVGDVKIGCIDTYNRAKASCERAYTLEVATSMLGGLIGPVGGVLAFANIAKATYILNRCLNDAWANYKDC